ncbi:MAG: class II glutamine amidotransferase [Acidobacteria bacterium]|nr:MAG: class II glutamine amidotransferase [Acidobacteriota bacterium]
MCRWLAYSGGPLYLEDLIFKPTHSLIDQSLHARAGETTTNGDGFGIGWYGSREGPGLYKDTQPAWNDRNLQDLAAQIESSLFLAHIRAATGTAIQQTNCHPFRFGRWLFMHNGLIRDFHRIKRELALGVAPELYSLIEGTTDSEIIFYLALTFGLDDDAVGAIERTVGFIEKIARENGIEHPVQMSLGFSDSERLYAIRYSTRGQSRTLFYSRSVESLRELNPEFDRLSSDARAVVSEPLNDLSEYWHAVPEATALVIERGEVEKRQFSPRPNGN